jgi:hypothetical protein
MSGIFDWARNDAGGTLPDWAKNADHKFIVRCILCGNRHARLR